jgi:hypothetical protein
VGIVLSWQNAAEAVGVSLSASSEAMGLGVQSLLTPTIADVWRSGIGGAGPFYLQVDFGASVPIRVVGIAAPRDGVLPGAGATWSVYGSNTTPGTANAFLSASQPLDMRRGTAARLLPSGTAARYLTVAITGVAGTPYLQLGRLWAGDALVTAQNVEFGWGRGVLDAGNSERAALSGVRTIQRGAVARTLDLQASRLSANEADVLDTAALAVGTTGQALLSPTESMAHAMFGRFTMPPGPTEPFLNWFTARIAFEEDL